MISVITIKRMVSPTASLLMTETSVEAAEGGGGVYQFAQINIFH